MGAPAQNEHAVAAESLGGVVHEGGLAHSSLADDNDEACRSRQQSVQGSSLDLPCDEMRPVPDRCLGGFQPDTRALGWRRRQVRCRPFGRAVARRASRSPFHGIRIRGGTAGPRRCRPTPARVQLVDARRLADGRPLSGKSGQRSGRTQRPNAGCRRLRSERWREPRVLARIHQRAPGVQGDAKRVAHGVPSLRGGASPARTTAAKPTRTPATGRAVDHEDRAPWPR